MTLRRGAVEALTISKARQKSRSQSMPHSQGPTRRPEDRSRWTRPTATPATMANKMRRNVHQLDCSRSDQTHGDAGCNPVASTWRTRIPGHSSPVRCSARRTISRPNTDPTPARSKYPERACSFKHLALEVLPSPYGYNSNSCSPTRTSLPGSKPAARRAAMTPISLSRCSR